MNSLRNIPLLVALLVTIAFAQPENGGGPQQNPGQKEKLESYKVAFFTNGLQLTPTEAQTFWPVYNQYETEMRAVRKEMRVDKLEMKDQFQYMTDQDVVKFMDDYFANQVKEVEIQKKYFGEFQKILPVRKAAKVFKLEQSFRMELLKMLKDRP